MSDIFKKNNDNKFVAYLFGSLVGVFTTIIIMFIFSALLVLLNLNRAYSVPFATISIAVGSFFASFFTAKKLSNKGYFIGFIIGIGIFLTITLCSLIFGNHLSMNTLFHFIIILLSSIIGGIIGVNYKKNKKYI